MTTRQVNLSNQKKRNALINYKGFVPEKQVLYVDSYNEPTQSKKYIKHTIDESYDNLLANYGNDPNKVAEALVSGDPEINLEMLGRYMTHSSRVYINSDQEIVFQIQKEEFLHNPEGEVIETRAPRHLEANINVEKPILWSGKSFPIQEVYKKFVLIRKYQLIHTNGLSFDMLYDIAKELYESQSMMLIGSGILLMHLSNMELKALPKE